MEVNSICHFGFDTIYHRSHASHMNLPRAALGSLGQPRAALGSLGQPAHQQYAHKQCRLVSPYIGLLKGMAPAPD
ncbi:hypothetical protein TorRG33x02_242070 [Trema orientale]|uniref:Uncharacterized protein n=1 Tax=Trema orientale TaxID=63057 RepID=A0A2P5DU02_TREOI|nr:hypothetical protein TorRG33x02_242070 [Trema orientale]